MKLVDESVKAINGGEVRGFDGDCLVETSVAAFEDIGVGGCFDADCFGDVADRATVRRFDCIALAFFVKMVDTSDAS